MDETEINRIADAVVERAFLRLGADVSTPGAVMAMQADFAFVRRSRLAGEALRRNAARAALYTLASGALAFVSWLAASLSWKGHP